MKTTHSIGRDSAIKLAKTKWWTLCTPKEIAWLQIFTAESLMEDFDVFLSNLSAVIGRNVGAFDLGLNLAGIQNELLGGATAPTLDEIRRFICTLDSSSSAKMATQKA